MKKDTVSPYYIVASGGWYYLLACKEVVIKGEPVRNMSYDKPIWVTLKIKSPKQEDNPARRIKVDYTFLHDGFGDQFRFVETEKAAPYDDIVKVECSPFAMVHWALQYSDRVEVVAPEEIRNAVVEKIRNLNVKYGL